MGIKHDDGCFKHAMDDEPLFTVLARDPCGPDTIRHWVMLRQALIGRGEKPQGDNSVMAEALQTAQDMVVWRDDATDPDKGYRRGLYRWQVARMKQDTDDVNKLDEVERLRERVAQMGQLESDNRLMAEALKRYEELLRLCQSKFGHYRDEHLKKCTKESDDKAQVNHDMVARINATIDGKTTPPMDRKWTSRIENKDMPVGGHPVDWDEVEMVWEFGNRFRLWSDEDGKWWIAEKETALAPTEWTGKYPLQHSLQADMLKAAYNDWHTRETARPFLTIEGGPRIREIRLGVTIQKIATGIRQVTDDLKEWAENNEFLTNMMDRLNGYAAEMRTDVNDLSSAFPAPRAGTVEAMEQSAAEAVHEIMGNHPDEVRAAITGFHSGGKVIGDPIRVPYADMGMHYKQAMTQTPIVDEGDTVRTMTVEETTEFRERIKEIAEGYDAQVLSALKAKPEVLKDLLGSSNKAPSDTLDVTDTPDMPPHRFTMFTKAKGWAYGRGLEIAPAHIPDMLDRMATDGWNLQCVFGGVEPTKVGMLFKRAPAVRWLGPIADRPVYPDWSPEARAAMRADISNPEVKLDHKVRGGRHYGVAMFRGHMVSVPVAMSPEDRRAVKNLLLCGDPTGCTDLGHGQEP